MISSRRTSCSICSLLKPLRSARTEELPPPGRACISVQVLNEATNVMRRKLLHVNGVEMREFLALLRGLLSVAPVTVETHELGLDFAERYGFSTYDAMIAAAATLNGCERPWSQDMQDGSGWVWGCGWRTRFR